MNLLFCTTPLQTLIAERIMLQYPGESFVCIYRGDKNQPRQRYYYERLRNKCRWGLFINSYGYGGGRIGYIYATARWLLGLCLSSCKRVFVASPEVFDFWLLFAGLGEPELYTYDDGTANLSPKAWAKWHYNGFETRMQRYCGRCFGLSTTQEILSKAIKHYTIYPYPNVLPNPEYIGLFDEQESLSASSKGVSQEVQVLRVFLGQAIYNEQQTKDNQLITERILRDYQISHYLPHPREAYRVEGVEYIKTELVAEEYFLQLLQEHPALQLELYSFCSTALLNMSATPRVSVTSIKIEGSLEHLDEIYTLYSNLGIKVKEEVGL